MTRLFVPFAVGMLVLGLLAWVVASAWPGVASDARAGSVLAAVAGVGGLAMKAQALRHGVKAALEIGRAHV